MRAKDKLRLVKLLHTIIWAFFVLCIVAIPVLGSLRHFQAAALFGCIVLAEVFVLVLNKLRCPLTDIAARYTEERRDNFDIYLPLWLARYNKSIFGALFVSGSLYTLVQWLAGSH